jgi:hypothetical protein
MEEKQSSKRNVKGKHTIELMWENTATLIDAPCVVIASRTKSSRTELEGNGYGIGSSKISMPVE